MPFSDLDVNLIECNGIELSVHSSGDGPAVVLCHGFPDLSYSWRHQIDPLLDAGFQVIVPDMRGFGASARPSDVDAYDVLTVCRDLVGLLDSFGLEEAAFVGHDWGATIVWQLAILFPQRVRAVAALSVPFTPRPSAPPISTMRERFGEDFYWLWFQEPGVADEVMASDVRWSLMASEEWAGGTAREPGPTELPAWWTEEDLEFYVAAFERTGFTGGLNYYRNLDRNWHLTEEVAEARIEQPSMFLTGSADLVRRFRPGLDMERSLTDMRANIVLDGARHWVHQEQPREVNEALIGFLTGL